MKSGDNFKLLYDLADKMNAAGIFCFFALVVVVFFFNERRV